MRIARIGGACVARKRIARNFGFLIKKVIRKLNESFTQQPRAWEGRHEDDAQERRPKTGGELTKCVDGGRAGREEGGFPEVCSRLAKW